MRRGRPVYCRNPADRERIAKRAASVGRTVSDFVMTCALHDGPDGTSPRSPPLVLAPDEQRELLRNVQASDARLARMFFGQGYDRGPALVDAVERLHLLYKGELPLDMEEDEE